MPPAEKRPTGRSSRIRGECETHSFGPGQDTGGGILRYVCNVCHFVSIDLTAADVPEHGEGLFASRRTAIKRP